MRGSSQRILTTQAGSLPRPPDLIELNRARQQGAAEDEAGFQARLRDAVREVVARQRAAGIDVPGDGELGKAMGQPVDYGAWWTYSFKRLGGLELEPIGLYDQPAHRSSPGHVVLSSFRRPPRPGAVRRCLQRPRERHHDRAAPTLSPGLPGATHLHRPDGDRARHRELQSGAGRGRSRGGLHDLDRAGELLANRQRVLRDATRSSSTPAPTRCARSTARSSTPGLILQLDDPAIAENWDQINPEPTVEDYRRFTMAPDRGAQPRDPRPAAGPHPLPPLLGQLARTALTDIPMHDIVDLMLAINAQAYSFEAGNVRHEHEWRVWEDVRLPDGQDRCSRAS